MWANNKRELASRKPDLPVKQFPIVIGLCVYLELKVVEIFYEYSIIAEAEEKTLNYKHENENDRVLKEEINKSL